MINVGNSEYIHADEEKFGQTLHEKIKRLKAIHKNLYLFDKIPLGEMKFDFIFDISLENKIHLLNSWNNICIKQSIRSFSLKIVAIIKHICENNNQIMFWYYYNFLSTISHS